MSVYTTAKCGHCGVRWTTLNPNVAYGIFGPPVIRCAECLKDNETKHKLLRDVNPVLKWAILIFRSFFGVAFSLAIIVGSGFMFYYWYPFLFENISKIGSLGKGAGNAILGVIFNIIGFMIPVGVLILGIRGVQANITYSKDVEDIEYLFDKNGGFLWSYEAYGYEYL